MLKSFFDFFLWVLALFIIIILGVVIYDNLPKIYRIDHNPVIEHATYIDKLYEGTPDYHVFIVKTKFFHKVSCPVLEQWAKNHLDSYRLTGTPIFIRDSKYVSEDYPPLKNDYEIEVDINLICQMFLDEKRCYVCND